MKPSSARETLLQEIEDLQSRIRQMQDVLQEKLRALAALEKAEIRQTGIDSRSLPYSGMRTWKAICLYLDAAGEPRTLKDVAKAMIDGGALYGKREWRAERNVKTAVKMSQELVMAGELIALAAWFDTGGKHHGKKLTERGVE